MILPQPAAVPQDNANAEMRVPEVMLVLLVTALLLTGCSSAPPSRTITQPLDGGIADAKRSEIVLAALGHLDTPYLYGGTDVNGLDCSALVQRVHHHIGRSIPRSSNEQARAAQRVNRARMQPGDVVFFSINGRGIDHVGIYIGGGRFVHAPNSRSRVRIEPLDNPYWQPRLRFAGHFL